MLKKVLISSVLLVSIVFAFGKNSFVNAENVDVMSNKVAIEARMEDRLKLAISSFLGTENVIATVRVNLSKAGIVSESESSNGAKSVMRSWDDSEETILPGVPAAISMVKKEKTKIDQSKTKFGVASLNLTLLVGKKLNDRTIDKIREIVVNMFGIDLDTGDTLSIESYDPLGKDSSKKAMTYAEVILFGFLLIIAYFLFFPLKNFMDVYSQNLHSTTAKSAVGVSSVTSSDEFAAISNEDNSDKEVHATLLPGSGSSFAPGSVVGEEVILFNKFINSETIDDLKLALSNEPADVIAKVISHRRGGRRRARPGGHGRPLRRPRRAGGREVQGRRPDRHPAAHRRRQEGSGRGQGGVEAPPGQGGGPGPARRRGGTGPRAPRRRGRVRAATT